MQTLEATLKELEKLVELNPQKEADLVVVNPRPNSTPKTLSVSNESAEKNGKPKIRENPTHQDQLSELISQTYALLKKYGEAADIASMRDAGFQMMLGDYSIEEVTSAFREYLKTGREIPTPADIIAIIDPSTQPLCAKVYQTLVMKDARLLEEGKMFRLTDDEIEYVQRYEDMQLRKVQ
jgi:hypothetical protein